MAKYDSDEILKTVRRMMQWVGSWPEENPPITYRMRGLFSICLVVFFAVTAIIAAADGTSNFDDISYGICCATVGLNYVVKRSITFYNKKKLYQILDILRHPLLTRHEDHLYVRVERKVRLCNLVRNLFVSSTMATTVVVSVNPLFDTKSGRTLPMPFPLDLDKLSTTAYGLLWGVQVVAVSISAWNVPCFDSLILTFMGIAAGQLEILGEEIAHVTDCVENKSNRLQATEDRDNMVNRLLQKRITQHVIIERYVTLIEDTFTFTFLSQLITGLVICCFVGFSWFVIPGDTMQFARCLFFFMSVVTQLAVFCIPGDEIMRQSEKIRDACYASEWNECGLTVRKTLFIMMERSKRPLILTAGKFVPLSLKTFVTVLQSAFSYFTVLRQMYSSSE